VRSAGLTGSYGGIKIYAGAKAASLDTVHFLFDEQAGFSAILKMFDHEPNAKIEKRDLTRTGMWTLRAPMLALSQPDSALGFPDGAVLQPQIFVRNTTGNPVVASLRFNWRGDSTTGNAPGPTVRLAPFETRRIDVAALQDAKTLPKEAHWTAVVLTTRGIPDEVMAVAASYDESLRYGAQTPFNDQLSYRWEGGMWEYDVQHDSVITVGNGGSKPAHAAFTIFYNQGKEQYELEQTLQPDSQMWIQVGKLIREQLPDKNGKTLPLDLTSGSYEIRDLTHSGTGTLFEGKVIYDKTYGNVAYGCAGQCCYVGARLVSDPLGIPFLGTTTNGVNGNDNCGFTDNVSSGFYGNWNTANHSIATVNTYGAHAGAAIGATTSSTHGLLLSPYGRYQCTNQTYTPGGGDNVNPTITSMNPQTGQQGTMVPVVIKGSGFGTNPTLTTTAGSQIQISGKTSNGTTINAVFTIASSLAPGRYTVVVTNTTQATTSFYVTAPCNPTVSSSTLTVSCDGKTVRQGNLIISGQDEPNVNNTQVSATGDVVTIDVQGSPYKYSSLCPPASICYDQNYIGCKNAQSSSGHINWNVQIFCSNSPYPSKTVATSETINCQ